MDQKKDIISVNTRVFKINKNYDKFETTEEVHKMRFYQLNKIKNQLKDIILNLWVGMK